jgi:hypothetical protein
MRRALREMKRMDKSHCAALENAGAVVAVWFGVCVFLAQQAQHLTLSPNKRLPQVALVP